MKPKVAKALFGMAVFLVADQLHAYGKESNKDVWFVITDSREIVITDAVYRLGDLGSLKCRARSVCTTLESLVVGRSPRPGFVKHLQMDQLKRQVLRRLPALAARIEWSGTEVPGIHRAGQRYDLREAEYRAGQALKNWLDAEHLEGDIRFTGEQSTLIVPAGSISIEAKVSPAARPRGRMPVWVDIIVDKEIYQTLTLWFDVKVSSEAYVLVRDVTRDSPITMADVRSAHMDIAGIDAPILSKEVIEGVRARRQLVVGAVLTESDIEPIPAVTKGAEVKVVVNQGGIALALSGIAKSDAELNQVVDIKNTASGELYKATVIAPGTVRAH